MIQRLTLDGVKSLLAERSAALDASVNPFATAAWMFNYLDHVATADGMYMAADVHGRALLLLRTEPNSPTQARALNNYYASQFSPFSGGKNDGDAEFLARELAALRPALATLDLSPLSLEDADCAESALKSAGWLTRRYRCFGNWYLPCEGLKFSDYMAARPSQTLNTWARKSKKFQQGAEARIELVTEPSRLASAMRAYEAVYTKSWKQPEPYPAFISGWAATCAARGWLRLGIAWSGDTPIAAQFWFTINRRAYIFKLAYDEGFSKLSAGTVLSASMFQHALDVDRVIEVDYLTGDDHYKRSWTTHRRQRVGVIGCNPRTLRGVLRGAYELAGAVGQRLRSQSGRLGLAAERLAGTEVQQ